MTGTKRARRRLVRYSLVATNIALLSGVGLFVASAAHSPDPATQSALLSANSNSAAPGPLDSVSSVDIAVNIARTTGLAESVAVTNQSDSMEAVAAVAPADTAVIAKPQIVATNAKSSSDIQTYVVQMGETIPSIAAKFNITSDSIRWTNNLTGDEVRAGTELTIPPVTGIVYTVLSGDTADSIAQKFRANKDQIIAFNDAEIGGIVAGQRIVIPNGQKPPTAAPTTYSFYDGGAGAFAATYGYNGYDRGWCTWYVANKIAVPTNWGNASTWDDRARLSGWTVSQTPRPGAIAQKNGGWGHVGLVEDVKVEGGVTYIKYSDMNGLAGFNRVGYSDWVPAIGKYQNFIYR